MKKLIIFIAIIAAILLIPPFFIGSQVESEINTQIEKANAHPAINLELIEYNKGWFESSAKIRLTVNTPADFSNGTDSISLNIIEKMQHGPFLWEFSGPGFGLVDSIVEFELPAEWQNELDKIESINKDTLSITSRSGFDLSTSTKLKLKSFMINQDDKEFSIKSAEGSFSYTTAGHVVADLVWQGLEASDATTKNLTIEGVSFSVDQQLVKGELFSPSALFSGNMLAKIANLNAESNNPEENVSIQQMEFNASSNLLDDLLNIQATFSAKSVQVIQQEFKDIAYDFSIDNLDANVLTEMNEYMLQNQSSSAQDPMQALATIQAYLPRLLEKSPVIKINKLGMLTSHGEIDSNMTLSINNELFNPENPMTMIVALQAEAQGHAPEAFFNELGMEAEIAQLLERKMLIKEEGTLKFEFSYKNAEALLNGEPMPIGL